MTFGDAQTLSELHLAVERQHDRKAVLEHRATEAPYQVAVEMPDWRFHRQILRIGLYLAERVGLGPGDRVAIVSRPSIDSLAVEWAAVLQGAVAVVADPDLPPAVLARALEACSPRATFLASAAREALRTAGEPGPRLEETEFVALDGDAPPRRYHPLRAGSRAGGTLDTAERAQGLRARARAVTPDMPALGFLDGGSRDGLAWRYLAHREAVSRARQVSGGTAKAGDVAYVTGAPPTLAMRTALGAFVADGFTRCVFGSRGRDPSFEASVEVCELRPRWIVGADGARPHQTAARRGAAWIRQWRPFSKA